MVLAGVQSPDASGLCQGYGYSPYPNQGWAGGKTNHQTTGDLRLALQRLREQAYLLESVSDGASELRVRRPKLTLLRLG